MKRMYKSCLVPGCTNTTVKTPEKLFVSVPKRPVIRKVWLKLARRNPYKLADDSTIFLCEDHFDMQKEMANYYQYKMGLSKKVLMVNGVVPSKFPWLEEGKKIMCDTLIPKSTTDPVLFDSKKIVHSRSKAVQTKIMKRNIFSSIDRKENTNSLGLQEKDVLYHKDHDNIGEPKVKIETDETFFENQNTMRFEGCWIESSGSSTDTASPVNDQTLDIYEAKENFETSELVDNKNFLEIGPGPSESCEQNFSVPFNVGAPEVKIEVDESNESIAQILRLPFVPCTDTLETEVKTEPGLGVDESMPEVNDEGQDFKRDACSSFGEYVATELRSLPLEDRFQIQKEIQDCLSAAAVRHISKLGASESTKVYNLPS